LFHPSSDCGDLTVGDHSAGNLSGTTNTCPDITGEATKENSEENSGVQIDIGAGAESEEESASESASAGAGATTGAEASTASNPG
jgi:hypothetical protein